jgi:hypothetical protein
MLNQPLDGRSAPTMDSRELSGMRVGGVGVQAWRSAQYRRTTKRRAMATLATDLPRRKTNR